ncbi:LysR family transcriptional regulator [Parasphingorhabdus cellanae]|uniref:LysR family transcriptional regulator n=1 Tax=Parasphingorhabdus cellanae TaxID=2806553 RepID=A0ABX7T9D8_9SPHN|nr:LysR family transcriptional regulator [Parasphingorhabdus cellanae]QTD57149.1 LysR family transcriptional regulator [Parasphingorhabdus cellanae]
MENWDDYRFILALDRSGTVRAAANLLGVTHSTVSRRLAVINARYGKPVFERAAGGYKKTELGMELVEAAQQMEEISFSADRRRTAGETDLSGPITLSIPDVLGQYLLLDYLVDFCRQYPDIKLSLDSTYRFADLDRSEADVVIRSVAKPPDHLVGRCLFPYALSLYCHRDYLEKTAPVDRRWITAATPAGKPRWIADSPFPDVPVGIMSDDITLRHKAVLEGHGMTRGACYMGDAEPDLIRLPLSPPPFPVADFWVLTHPDLKNTPRIKVLMQFLTAALLENQDLIEGRLASA